MYSEIQHYSIFIDSGTPNNRCITSIHLFDAELQIIGVLQFLDPGYEVPDRKDHDVIHLQYSINKFPYVLDVLRNEKPVYIGYWENKYGKYGRIYTGMEGVGEGEIELSVNQKQTS